MNLIIGSDHAGFTTKERLKALLIADGHEVEDAGPSSEDPCDYPDIAAQVAARVARHGHEGGILICGTGIGMSIAANKIKGVRAALCHNLETASMSRAHNDANILCLGARVLEFDLLLEITRRWIDTPFEQGRHARRLEKINDLECD
jgi:ribose 5-phosphate isomerase B